MKNIIFFDTTLRDGDQASGFQFFRNEKIAIARQLDKLGVDVIEAGFAASSKGDAETIRQITKEVRRPIICSLSRAKDYDIEESAKALEDAARPRIHTFIATSDIHVKDKLRKSREEIINIAIKAVRKARLYVDDVEFSCEDFGRSDSDYTASVVSEVIRAGATTVNLPDTVGWLLPNEAYDKVKYVIDKVRSQGLAAIFSVHNHNDQGMATANTIQGILAGAQQVEVTINGIGERAGNTALEEVLATLIARKIGFHSIKPEYIRETSEMVSKYSGVNPQPNKAIVGRNAFAHEAGIHQDGMIKNGSTYEILQPHLFGYESRMTFGPRSGSNALRYKYQQMGIDIGEYKFEEIFNAFKELGDRKKAITDQDLRDILKI